MFIPEREYSDQTARIIDEEVKRIIDEAYACAEKLVSKHWSEITAVAEALLKYETLQGEEVQRLLKGEPLDKPTVAELLEQEAAKPTPQPPETKQTDQSKPETGGDVLPSPA
jgi:cell division protease FtsH